MTGRSRWGMHFSELLEHLDSIQARHHHIEKHEIRVLLVDHLERLNAGGCLADLESVPRKSPGQYCAIIRYVIHDQKCGFSGHDQYAKVASYFPAQNSRFS